MNTKEKMMMQPMNEYVAAMLKQRNKGTEDCITTTEYARELGMTAHELNKSLIDMDVMMRRDGQLKLTIKYQEKGYTKNRSSFKYTRQGQLKEIVFPVWTSKGVEFLNKKLGIRK